jgi:hypothetical protein
VKNSITRPGRQDEMDQAICGEGNGCSKTKGGGSRGGSREKERARIRYRIEKIGCWPNNNVHSSNDGSNWG